MALKKLLRNIWNTLKYQGSTSEKISLFSTLCRLQFKRGMSPRKNTRVREHFLNYTFHGYEYGALEHLFNEIFVGNEYKFQTTNPAPQIIDCGSNIGMSVLYFKKCYPESKIIAFEANPHAYELLKENMTTNHIEDVEIHNMALYDQETEISFFIGEHRASLMGSVKKGRSGDAEMKIPARRLSGYLKDIESIDLIKIDVEGAETQILSDLVQSGMLTKAQQYIIEYHHNMHGEPSRLADFLRIFENHGFNYSLRTTYETLNTFQDILIHFYKSD